MMTVITVKAEHLCAGALLLFWGLLVLVKTLRDIVSARRAP